MNIVSQKTQDPTVFNKKDFHKAIVPAKEIFSLYRCAYFYYAL